MHLVKLINIISSILFCYGLDLNNVTEGSNSDDILRQKRGDTTTFNNRIKLDKDKIKLRLDLNSIFLPKITYHTSSNMKENDFDSLKRQKRGPPVLNNQNKLNSDKIRLQLDLKKRLPKISPQRTKILQQPITNIRVRPKPIGLANRLNAIETHEGQSKLSHTEKSNPIPPSTPPKMNEKTKTLMSETLNITKCASESKNPKFYVDTDDDEDKTRQKSSVPSPKLPSDVLIKETVLTKQKEECVDGNKDKKDAIIGLMNQLPSIIKRVLTDRVKSEGNPIIIKNITEITLPIQRGSKIKMERQPCVKPEEVNSPINIKTERYSKEVQNLLLKPFLEAKQNNADVPYSSSQVLLENEIASIEIKQNNYSEVMEQELKPIVVKTEENIPPFIEEPPVIPYSTSLCENSGPASNLYQNAYNSDSTYTTPYIQATTPTLNPNPCKTYPMYTTPACSYSNLYTPYTGYMKSPYAYSQLPQNFYKGSAMYAPKSSPTNNGRTYAETNSCDDNNNKNWKTWSNTEIVIKTNNNPAYGQYQRPMYMNSLSYPRNCNGLRKFYIPMYMSYPQLPRYSGFQ